MKALIYISILLAVISCGRNTNQTIISVLHDVTEKDFEPFDSKSIIDNLGVEENKWTGYTFRYQSLTDSDYNKITEVYLKPERQILSNRIDREGMVEAFINDIQACQTNYINGFEQSSIFIPLVKEIEYLSVHYPDDPIKVILYSDLMDNNDWINCYHNKAENREEIISLYQQCLPKLPLKNKIRLCIIFLPHSGNNKEFRDILEIYTVLCKEMNISIEVSASIH